jgi:hypothetical protein
MAKGEATALSRSVSGTKRVGKSMGAAISKNPKKSIMAGGVALGAFGMMRGRRGSGTGRRMPGSERGIRNY